MSLGSIDIFLQATIPRLNKRFKDLWLLGAQLAATVLLGILADERLTCAHGQTPIHGADQAQHVRTMTGTGATWLLGLGLPLVLLPVYFRGWPTSPAAWRGALQQLREAWSTAKGQLPLLPHKPPSGTTGSQGPTCSAQQHPPPVLQGGLGAAAVGGAQGVPTDSSREHAGAQSRQAPITIQLDTVLQTLTSYQAPQSVRFPATGAASMLYPTTLQSPLLLLPAMLITEVGAGSRIQAGCACGAWYRWS
jgi:hypothetical protein